MRDSFVGSFMRPYLTGKFSQENTMAPTLYDYQFNTLDRGAPLPLSQFKGKVVLIVNTASKCGFSSQYLALEELYQRYKNQGLEIVGVPSNDFMNQEPGTSQDISHFCRINYGVTFHMTEKVSVKGPDTHPFYQWINQIGGFLGRARWNFYKFIFDRNGAYVTYYGPFTRPNSPSLVEKIEELLKEDEHRP